MSEGGWELKIDWGTFLKVLLVLATNFVCELSLKGLDTNPANIKIAFLAFELQLLKIKTLLKDVRLVIGTECLVFFISSLSREKVYLPC